MKLLVTLLEARNLQPLDRVQAYAVLRLGKAKQTSSVSPTGASDPYWYQDFSFPADDLESELHLSLWNKDKISDASLGAFTIPISTIFDSHNQSLPSTWYALKRVKQGKATPSGEIKLAFSLSSEAPTETGPSVEPPDKDKNGDELVSAGADDPSISSFFSEDVGNTLTSTKEDLPPPLEGGILIDGHYAISAKSLNKLIFGPGSKFLCDLAELQKSTQFVEAPWKKGDAGLPTRTVSYIKAATKMLKSVKATEQQAYIRADDKGFVVTVSATTPDAPYGNTFRVDLQYCIFSGPDLSTEEKTSFLQVSWKLHFLSNTIMKAFIENGARQGLQESYKQFSQVLEKFVRVMEDSEDLPPEKDDTPARVPKTDWQLVKEYFLDVRICLATLITLLVLVHIFISKPSGKGGFELWIIDFPDTLREFIISAILGVQIQYIFEVVKKFLRARTYKGSDHGVKARGNGWLLRVTLVEAENIPVPKENGGPPNPYIVFTCLGQSRRSSVRLQTSNPGWKENFEFNATEDAPAIMNVEVFSFEGPFTEAEALGHAEINFLTKTPEELADFWAPLQSKDTIVTGARIHLQIVLMNMKQADNETDYLQRVEKDVGVKISKQTFMKNSSFQALFKLPAEEFLVNDFSCALKKRILLQGRLFLSPRVLAFNSNIFGHKTKFMLLWEDIDEIVDITAGGSVVTLINPAILVFARKGRAPDARHAAKSEDAKGRLTFQFQSFIAFKPAYKLMMALWKNRKLSPEEQKVTVAKIPQEDEGSVSLHGHAEEPEVVVGEDEVILTEVYAKEIPFSVNSMVRIFEKNLDERIAEKVGWLAYSPSSWEIAGDDVQERCLSFQLSNQIALFGAKVTCIQQKSAKEYGHSLIVEEDWTLHDIPTVGEYFQMRVRKEVEDTPLAVRKSLCRVYLGIAQQKTSKAEPQVSKNILDRQTEHLKKIIDVTVKEVLEHGLVDH